MRRLLPLVLLVAACTSTAGDTTTTAPLAEPSTTTTMVSSTTITMPTTTTTVEVCMERDGVLRDRRGFVCPPHLVGWDGSQFDPNPPIHLPGRYDTRAFAVPFSFVAPVRLPSNGDSNSLVQFFQGPNDDTASSYPPRSAMRVWTSDAAAWISVIPETEWDWGEAVDMASTMASVDGYRGIRHDFICQDAEDSPTECVTGNLTGIPIGYRHGQHVTLIDIDTPAGQVVFEVFADPGRIDQFWTEVAQPILDSIEFLDD